MEHLAIMRKSWGLTKKILSGEKKIESRWYKSKYPPWGKIRSGEIVYFKDSGEPVSISICVLCPILFFPPMLSHIKVVSGVIIVVSNPPEPIGASFTL